MFGKQFDQNWQKWPKVTTNVQNDSMLKYGVVVRNWSKFFGLFIDAALRNSCESLKIVHINDNVR